MTMQGMQARPGDAGRGAPILRVRDIGKRYPLYRGAGHRLARALFGALAGHPPEYVALENVSFDLRPGDAMAVIGRNGAGKSTLLQILSGVLEPTTGAAESPARVAGLLELGSGFNPEFSGRENVFINGAILGLTRRQMQDRLASIIEFADIGAYIDQPVKFYSSGMFLRLAFSVAIHAEPELLLVDEALTVGDVFFRQKCYARLSELRSRGLTVLLVTHSMEDAAEFCNRGIVLSQGRVAFEGGGKEAVEYYFHHERETPTGRHTLAMDVYSHEPASGSADGEALSHGDADRMRLDRPETIDLSTSQQFGQPSVKALRLLITDTEDTPRRVFQQGDWLRVYVDFRVDEAVAVPLAGIQLVNAKGVLVHGRNSLQFEATPPNIMRKGTILRCMQEIKLDVDTGPYTLEAGLAEVPKEVFERRDSCAASEIAVEICPLCHVSGVAAISVIFRSQAYPCAFSHYGVANLPSRQHLMLLSEEPAEKEERAE
jgi:lipopolysaccharide transport system ATP-binding protein